MNRSTEILACLSADNVPRTLILAPNAPPVSRTAEGARAALNIILSPEDVNDTLIGMRTHAGSMGGLPPEPVGAFSFGLRGVGRFKVGYLTQRGSKVVSITRISLKIPDLYEVSSDLTVANQLLSRLCTRGAMIAMSGPDAANNGMIVYAFLQKVNEQSARVICSIEPTLSYLMHHDNSIVIQCEVDSDVMSLEEGVRGALLLQADLVYVGDVRAEDRIPSASSVVEAGGTIILSSSSLSAQELAQRFRPQEGLIEVVGVDILPLLEGKSSIQLLDLDIPPTPPRPMVAGGEDQ